MVMASPALGPVETGSGRQQDRVPHGPGNGKRFDEGLPCMVTFDWVPTLTVS